MHHMVQLIVVLVLFVALSTQTDGIFMQSSTQKSDGRAATMQRLVGQTSAELTSELDVIQRPLDYWDSLRNSSSYETRPGSALYQLASIVGDCNVYLMIVVRDNILSPIVASRTALEYLERPNNVLTEPYPIAVAGAGRSAVSEPLSILAGAYGTLVISSQSTASSLDNKDKFPTFARSIPTSRIDSKAVIAYFKSIGVTHFGVLFIRDAYGSEYNRDLASEASKQNMTVVSSAWDEEGGEASVIGALKKLRDTQFRYFFAILAPAIDKHKIVIRNAIDLEIMGSSEYMWLYADSSNILREESFYSGLLESSDAADREIASALNGAGLVVLHFPQNEDFNRALQDVGTNGLLDYYVSRFEAPTLFETLNWQTVPNIFLYAAYDSLISLGIGLCSIPKEFPTATDVVQAVKNVSFTGSAGPVSYNKHTGTRSEESVQGVVVNLLIDTSGNTIKPKIQSSVLVNVSSQEVKVLSRFVYSDGTFEPPLALPPLNVNLNLIGIGARVFGWVIAGIVILLSVFFGYCAFRYRKKNSIRVAQPIFLGLMCLGAALMASTIIPMSFQEPMPQSTLDTGCQAIPWLFVMGFATAFSSLFCKLLRLNKVFRESASMRQVKVRARDVMLPFAVLFLANFTVLLAWSLVAPLRWTRMAVANYDQFGRSVESYGTCFGPTGGSPATRNAFLVTLGILNFSAVVLANYQCYLSRNVPSDFNESYYIGLSMMSILEGFLLGVPIIYLTIGIPTAQFVMFAVLIFLLCLAILLPTFGSKIFIKREHSRLRKSQWRRAWRDYDESQHFSRRTGGSYSRDVSSRAAMSASATHLSSVAEIRARVAEKRLQESKAVSSLRTKAQKQCSQNHAPH